VGYELELCQLPINCLKRDIHGDFFQFIRWKMSKEDTIPISLELAKVIQEQQQYIQDNLGEHFEYLFCAKPHGFQRDEEKIYSQARCDDCCLLYQRAKGIRRVQYHRQFRKTLEFSNSSISPYGRTRMVNSGVPMHIIQRYLGHESPAMTQVYAHIHDATLKKEITSFIAK